MKGTSRPGMNKVLASSAAVAITGLLVFGALNANADAVLSSIDIYTVEGITNSDGRFDIAHGLNLTSCPAGGYRNYIFGMTAAIQNGSNGSWYGAQTLYEHEFFTAWSNTNVSGQINNNPHYTNANVRVTIFVSRIAC